MTNNNWGTALLGAILLLLVAGGLYTWDKVQRAHEEENRRKQVEETERQRREFEAELRTFAETHLGDLQKLIDEIEEEIQVRRHKLDKFASDLRRAGKAPELDKNYKVWSQAIVELQKKAALLLNERKETWIALKTVENNPVANPDKEAEREARLKLARVRAEETRKEFEGLRDTDNVGDVPVATPAKEEKPQPKKRSFFGWLFGS